MGLSVMTKIDIELPSHSVSVSLIMDVVVRCSLGATDIQALETYTGKSGGYLKSAITSAVTLGMISSEDEFFLTVPACAEPLSSTPSHELKIAVFRMWSQRWEPFILFLRYLAFGDSVEVAARKLSSFYLFNRNVKGTAQILLNWAKSSGFVDSKGKVVEIDYRFEEQQILNDLSEESIDDVKARFYLVDKLGDEVFNWLQYDEQEELIQGIIKYKTDARGAIECAGRAFEDVLRRVSSHLGFNTSKLNGISQVVNPLYHNKDSEGKIQNMIHSKQLSISQAIGDIRNMAGHSKEAKTMERWELSPTAAFGLLLTTISTIRSIYQYVMNRKYIY
jgi:hypothetical protein